MVCVRAQVQNSDRVAGVDVLVFKGAVPAGLSRSTLVLSQVAPPSPSVRRASTSYKFTFAMYIVQVPQQM